jgi:phenylalanyl-tRNA synthetase beta chain
LCHKGVARELAVAYDGTVKLPEIVGGQGGRGGQLPRSTRPTRPPQSSLDRPTAAVDGVEVRLEDPEGAPRYMIAVIRGVTVRPSPMWLAARLQAVGQRPINNIVDATNYILFEINQPLHAFDLAKLRGPAVVVRRARPNEGIVTLDGVSRRLTAEMTVICDAERPQIVAGVMGSAESGVTETTTDVVLEAAYFQPTRIRRTRRALSISSESSYRFERGIDMLAMPDALARAVDLIRAIAGGEVREPPVDLWPEPQKPRSVFLRPERVSHLLGVAVPRREIEQFLSAVGFVAAPKDDRLAVQVPGWRPDVTREVDLIEEVARLRGYDTFPDEVRPYRPGTVPESPSETTLRQIREHLVRGGSGLLEARTLPLGPADSPDAVPVKNPLSAEEAHLRSRLLPGLVRRVEHNWSAGNRDVRLFEIGTTFRKGTGGRPTEELSLAIVLTGARHPMHWAAASRAKLPDMDIWDLKHHFELAVEVAAPFCTVQPAPSGTGWIATASDKDVVWGSATPLEADSPKWGAPLYGLEVRIARGDPAAVRYQALPTQPALVRDLSLVLPAGVTAAAVKDVLRREGGALLERLDVLDEYRGPGLPEGTRGVTWRCTFRDPEGTRTLTDREVDALLSRMLTALEVQLNVRRRSA